MKLIKITLLYITSFIISFAAYGQNAEDIIAKHIKAHGGEKKWDEVKSMQLKGKFTSFSEEHDFFAVKTNDGKYYSDLNIGHHKVKEAFNGKTGWTIDPWHDFTYPRKLNKNENIVFTQKSDLFTPFYNYKEKGSTVEYIGEKKVDGIDTYALKIVRKNGSEETWYLNKETYLEYKCESYWVDFAMPSACETFFDDFRKVNGMTVPFYIERMFGQRNRMLQLESVEFNKEFDEALLKMPRSEQMKKFELIKGKWTVTVERLNRRGEMQKVDETVSKCKFKSLNLLQMKITVDDYYVQPMRISFSYHKDSGKYRVVIYSDFASSVDFYEGDFKDGVFTADNLNNFGENESRNSLQLKIFDITEDSFNMEINRSTDKGENWMSYYKLSFSK